jgi:ribokinase
MIIVFGALNMDLLFHVKHVPQAGEVILTPSYETVPGGKGGNQAVAAGRALRGLKARVHMAGCVGEDGYGQVLLHTLREAGVDVSLVEQRHNVPTGIAPIFIDAQAENHIVVAQGANAMAHPDQVPDKLLGPDTLLLLQQEVPTEATAALIARAHRAGARILLNLAPAGPIADKTLRQLTYFVVNEIEAASVAETYDLPKDAPEAMATALAAKFGFTCILTLGARGALAATPDGTLHPCPPLKVEPVDTTGAGDAFIGALAAALDQGEDLPEALKWGAVAGALTTLKTGAQAAIPGREEIAARL